MLLLRCKPHSPASPGFIAVVSAAAMFHAALLSAGQVVVDNSFGHGGVLSGPNFAIPAAIGRQVGTNLFQSFNSFNLDSQDSATFTAPLSTKNILVRVTGGTPSLLNGAIISRTDSNASQPHPASFFFVNPAGVIFGPDARLDVGGSFSVTTADEMRLADGGALRANLSQASVLSSAAPAAFGFVSRKPIGIGIQGGSAAAPTTLAVTAGQSLSVVAGPVQIVNGMLLRLRDMLRLRRSPKQAT